MTINVEGKVVPIVVSDEIRKSITKGEEMKAFCVRMACTHKVYVNGVFYYNIKKKMEGKDKVSLLNARIAELEALTKKSK